MARRDHVSDFLAYARGECAHAGVKLYLDPRAGTKDGYLGAFDYFKKELLVCVANPLWLGVLAHELSHLHQWAQNVPAWSKGLQEDCDAVYENWIKGKDTKPELVKQAVRGIQRCEWDAEKRAVKLIKKYRLVDPKIYTRSANMYILKYEFARRHRAWVRTDHLDPAIFEGLVPDDRIISAKSFGKLPEKLEQTLLAMLHTP